MTKASSRCAALLITFHCEILCFECRKEPYAEDVDFEKILEKCSNGLIDGDFHIHDGYLIKGNWMCIPCMSLHEKLIWDLYGSWLNGHGGRDKIMSSLEDKYYWSQPTCDANKFVFRCLKQRWSNHKTMAYTCIYLYLNIPEKIFPWILYYFFQKLNEEWILFSFNIYLIDDTNFTL